VGTSNCKAHKQFGPPATAVARPALVAVQFGRQLVRFHPLPRGRISGAITGGGAGP